MNKTEFEKKFIETIKEKLPLRACCEYALRDYLRFIDDHKIYEYKTYDQLLAIARAIRIQGDATVYLDQKKSRGMFSSSTYLLMLKPNPNPSTLVHELTHALSSKRRISFDCDTFKKETAPEMTTSVYLRHHDFSKTSTGINEKEKSAIIRWYERNSYLFADTKTSRPNKLFFSTGFDNYWQEFSEFVSTRKIDSSVKTNHDMKKYFYGQIGDNFYFEFKNSKSRNFNGISEGVTELIAKMIISYSCQDRLAPTYGGYVSQAMIAAQLYAIFGEQLFEGYFTNEISPMAKKLDLNEDKLAEIMEKVSAISQSIDHQCCEQNMQIVNEIQVDIIKLFERKMLRELAKFKNDFNSPLDMRNAIVSSFFDYSKFLHFGTAVEELVNPNFGDVWIQLEKSLNNCIAFGNKLLARRQKSLMNKISPKTMNVFKNQNYLHYDYVGKDMREITLANRLALFDFEYAGPDEKRKEYDANKIWKIDQIPGEVMFLINNGADQTALYCYAMGEDVDEELLKTDAEREQK